MTLFNFNKAPAATFEGLSHVRVEREPEPVRVESMPFALEKMRAFQEAHASGIVLPARHGVQFPHLVSGERGGLPTRAGPMGNAGVVLFFSGLLTAAVTGVALLLGVTGLGHIVATAAIVAAVGAVLVGGDGGR